MYTAYPLLIGWRILSARHPVCPLASTDTYMYTYIRTCTYMSIHMYHVSTYMAGRVSYRIFVWEGEIFFKDGKPKLNHVLNA